MTSSLAIQHSLNTAFAAGVAVAVNGLNNNANNNPRIDGWAGV